MTKHQAQVDDLARYQERYTAEEREELALAGLAMDIIFLLDRARRRHGHRTVVTVAFPAFDVDPNRLQVYLRELGYDLRLSLQDLETGRYIEVAPARRPWSARHLRPRRLPVAGD